MPGANWTRKDYQAIAEMAGRIAREHPFKLAGENRTTALFNMIADECLCNAALTHNGNRNFDRHRFLIECRKQAGLA